MAWHRPLSAPMAPGTAGKPVASRSPPPPRWRPAGEGAARPEPSSVAASTRDRGYHRGAALVPGCPTTGGTGPDRPPGRRPSVPRVLAAAVWSLSGPGQAAIVRPLARGGERP